MAIVAYIGKQRFARIFPGDPVLVPIDWPRDDNGIWKQVSGDWVEINGVCHVLFRHAGVLFLRLGNLDIELDELAKTALHVEGDQLKLRVDCAKGAFCISEPFPELLRNDPILDHIQCETYLWTYRVHAVLSEPDERESYWMAERSPR